MPKTPYFGVLCSSLKHTLSVFAFFSSHHLSGNSLPSVVLPIQEPPPKVDETVTPSTIVTIGDNPNLVVLLDQIRKNASSGNLLDAQKLASEALAQIESSQETEFYLRQIKSEETKLYFKLANEAMLSKRYALASQYIQKYRENVSEELSSRKVRQNLSTEIRDSKMFHLLENSSRNWIRLKKTSHKFEQNLVWQKMMQNLTLTV